MSGDAVLSRAAELTESHRGHRSTLALAEDRDIKGLRGQQAFCERYGLHFDLRDQPLGDGGVDGLITTIYGVFAWDAKCYQKPRNLVVVYPKCKARTIYVLCRYLGPDRPAELLGWEWGSKLLARGPGDYCKTGVVCYALPRERLRRMSDLDAVVRHGA